MFVNCISLIKDECTKNYKDYFKKTYKQYKFILLNLGVLLQIVLEKIIENYKLSVDKITPKE